MLQSITSSEICTLIFIWQVCSPAKVVFTGVGVLLSVCSLFFQFFMSSLSCFTCQAAKDVRASQNTLIDVFERIEMFFRRLETYTQVPPTTEMIDMIVQIMVEVLSILGIATKAIKQGRMSGYFAYKYDVVD